MQPLPLASLETEFEEVKLDDDEDDKEVKKKRFWQRQAKKDDAAELRAIETSD
jgi:hypothetical protein